MIIDLSSVRNIIDNYDKNIAGNKAEPCSSGITCIVYLDVLVLICCWRVEMLS